MGINGLWTTISKKYPHTLKSVYRRSFRGRRIAVDANYWFFVLRAAIRSRVINTTDVINNGVDENQVDILWIEDIFKHLLNWLSLGITPILVYDGPSPVKKAGTKIKRTSDKERVLKRIEEVNERINLVGDRTDFAKLQELGITDLAEFDKQNLEEMRGLLSQLSYIPADSLQKVKNFFRGLGFPTLTADGDGERLTAAICLAGVAAAAYSGDGDSLVHGCPILIRGPGVDVRDERNIPTQTFEMVFLYEILEALEVNFTQFVDMCITAGCDYNVNMPGKAIGAAIRLVKKYGSIDNFPRDQHDITCLDHIDCRELFRQVPIEKLILESSVPELPVMTPDELSAMLGISLNLSPEAYKSVPAGTMFDMAPIQVEMIDSYKLSMMNHFALYEMEAYMDRYLSALKLLTPPVNFTHSQYFPDSISIIGDQLENVSVLTVKKSSQRKPKPKAKVSSPVSAPSSSLLHYNPMFTMNAIMPLVYTPQNMASCSDEIITIEFD